MNFLKSVQIQDISNDDALTKVLVQDGSTGTIKYRTSASLGGGGGTIDAIPVNGSTNAVQSDGVFDALALKQATLVNETNIKSVNGQSLIGSGGTNVDIGLLGLQALGSTVKAMPIGIGSPMFIANVTNRVDASLLFTAVYLPTAATLTGIKFYLSVTGNFTGDATNGLALYSYSGGTLTKVAESANDPNIWKGSANTWQTVAFGSTYAAAAGVYFAASLYNNSAQTTAPNLGTMTAATNQAVSSFDFTNSAKLSCSISAQSAFGASYAASGLTASNSWHFMCVY